MRTKKVIIILGALLPLVAHAAITLMYAYGDCEGQHCAGLLDAVWEYSQIEYYLDWMFNPFTIIGLLFYIPSFHYCYASRMAFVPKI